MGALSGPSGKLVTFLGIAFAGAGFLRETLNLERPRIFGLVAVFLRLVLVRPLGGSRLLDLFINSFKMGAAWEASGPPYNALASSS